MKKNKLEVICELCGRPYLISEGELTSKRHKYNICKDCRKNGKIFICENCGKEAHINIQAYLKDNRHLCKTCKYEITCENMYGKGVKNIFQSEQFKKDLKNKMLEKYRVENCSQSPTIKQKKRDTCQKYFGVDWPLQSNENQAKAKATCMKNYGTEYYLQSKDAREKTIETIRNKYKDDSLINISQVEEIKSKVYKTFLSNGYKYYYCRTKTYFYDNIYFDSGYELYYFIYLTLNNINFIYHPEKDIIEYNYGNTIHHYEPDFRVGKKLVELKGGHFIKEDGTWCDPYNPKNDDMAEAKHQIIIKNNVEVITDIKKYKDFVDSFYNQKDYIKQFKVKKEKTKNE